MVDNEINELAVIFNRVESEDELIQQFVPVRVVDGYYEDMDMCFVDSRQNVYAHMASDLDFGNVYAGRKSITQVCKKYGKLTYSEIKEKLLHSLQKYEFYKCVDFDSKDYQVIKIKNKKTGEISNFSDKETEIYRQIYNNAQEALDDFQDKKEIKEETNTESDSDSLLNFTPNELIERIKKTVKGQDEAVEKIATLFWIRYNYPEIPKSNMLVIGPTGVGKTLIFTKIKEIFDIPLAIYSIPGTSQAGYVGHSVDEMLQQLYYDSGKDINKTQNGIVMIDEFDKIASNHSTGEIGTIAVQNELLKLIEGCERIVSLDNNQSVKINTANITFVCCGAFTDLREVKKDKVVGFNTDLIKEEVNEIDRSKVINSGIARELIGRLPFMIYLNDLNNKEVLRDILLNSDESMLTQIVHAIESRGVVISNIDSVIDYMVEAAIKEEIGVRGLINSVMNTFLKIFKEIGNNPGKYNQVIIGENIVHDNTDFKLIKKDVKVKVKTETLGLK